ncbi:uncharacterized protein [Amphiura filiformis]|uniref:uncharacterized protein n=1 Tax=Amphiura filiformis TaxID=82378 RepID=UPI003B2168F0
MLDRVMISFRKMHFPAVQTGPCMFFFIPQDYSNQPKTEQQVKKEILKKLNTYKWDQFDTRFPQLFEFLVKLQPAYPGNTDNWYLALSHLVNQSKHQESLHHSEYDIPIIWNGKKQCRPIPKGKHVYGPPASSNEVQVDGVKYETFKVVDVARKAAIEVECIVAEFYKHM